MEHNKIRFVTANYAQLQGLRLVPIGVFLLLVVTVDVMGLAIADGVPPAERARFLTRIGLAFWVMLGLSLAAPAYYRYRFGSVDGFDRRERNRWITLAVIAFFMLRLVDHRLEWPVSLSLLLVSASLAVTAWHDDWIRPYYPALAVVWLVAGCLPALGGPSADSKVALFGLGGVTLIAIGIGDHVLLQRALGTTRAHQ